MNQFGIKNTQQREYNRHLFLFDSVESAGSKIFQFFNDLFQTNQMEVKGVITSSNSSFLTKMKHDLNESYSFPHIEFALMNQINAYLGSTLDFIVMDLRTTFSPNILVSLVETVRGGGLIILIGNDRDTWLNSVNKDYLPNSKSSHLLDWFLSNISKNTRCIVSMGGLEKIISLFKPMPFEINLDKNFIGIPVSSNQNDVIMELISDLNDKKSLINTDAVIADRGRGKSAAVGLTIAKYIIDNKSPKSKIIITSRNSRHTQTIFKYIKRGLKVNNIRHRLKEEKEQIVAIEVPKRSYIEFRWVSDVSKDVKCQIIIVDEAAAFPQEKLQEIVGMRCKKILISTIHGNEGSGRSFQYKILRQLQKRHKNKFRILRLTDPIRYMIEDPIESLMNETFLLKLDRVRNELNMQFNVKEETNLIIYTESSELFSNENLHLLEEMMRILIYAHYRNQPNDLLLIADSKQHILGNLSFIDSEDNKHILLALQLSKEGLIDSEKINNILKGDYVDGNLIPSIAIRHFSSEFAKLKGIRIVRIASDPDLNNKGFGRVTIEKLMKLYQNQDWIGVSCGATSKLVKFWRKLGFKAIHIRPNKSPETGEWNIVLVNPISEAAQQIIDHASRNFALQYIYLLRHSLFDIKPELAILILRSCTNISDYKPNLTQSAKYRLQRYIEGNLNFLLAVDGFQDLVVNYFITPLEFNLSPSQELLLMTRILQGRTWGQTLQKTGLKWQEANGLLQKAIIRLTSNIITEES